MGSELTAEELDERLAWIDALHEEKGVNAEAEAERDRRRKVEIYDDFCHVETETRSLRIPQPTLGFLMMYHERRDDFEGDDIGLGRLLVALKRMREPGYIRALRMGEGIPNEEAEEALNQQGVYLEDKVEYYLAIEAAGRYGQAEAEKKTRKLLAFRTGIDSDLMERLRSLSSLPATPLTKSSTECPSASSTT